MLWEPRDDFGVYRNILQQLKISFVKLSLSYAHNPVHSANKWELQWASDKRCNKSEEICFGKNHLVNAIKIALSCKCQSHSLPRVGLSHAGRGSALPWNTEQLGAWLAFIIHKKWSQCISDICKALQLLMRWGKRSVPRWPPTVFIWMCDH